jgi:hypothetical protein
MQITTKNYNINKIKNYTKNNSFVFFFNGINRTATDWIIIEQKIKKIKFSYYKITNKISKKPLQNSIYFNIFSLINSVTFVLKPLFKFYELTKGILLKSFESILFIFLSLKLNNKIYSKNQIKNLFSLCYKDNNLLFFQFVLTNIKLILLKNKKSK